MEQIIPVFIHYKGGYHYGFKYYTILSIYYIIPT